MAFTPCRSQLFSQVFPSDLAVREYLGQGDPSTLLPEEARTVRQAVISRQREFAAGRSSARAALASLGFQVAPLLPGVSREPIWPPGVVGSITHTKGLAAAVVGMASKWSGLGLDAEPLEPLPEDIVALVTRESERNFLAELPTGQVPWDRIVFSAKESVYKVWFPIRREWLDFDEVEVFPQPDGTFAVRLIRNEIGNFPQQLMGRWATHADFVATGVALPGL